MLKHSYLVCQPRLLTVNLLLVDIQDVTKCCLVGGVLIGTTLTRYKTEACLNELYVDIHTIAMDADAIITCRSC
jgi:hypothetical protein